MNCPKCGFANSPYDKVCRDCGEPLVNNESNNIFGDDILKPITVNNLEDIDNNLNEEEVNQVVESNETINNEVSIEPKESLVNNVEETNNNPVENEPTDQNISMNEIQPELAGTNPVINEVVEPNINTNQKVKQPFDFKKTLIVVIGIIFASALLLVAVVILTRNKDNGYSGTTTAVNEDYKINFNGYDMVIPSGYKYQTSGTSLIITDKDTTWMTIIEVSNFNYSQLLINKDKIKTSYEQMGMIASDMIEKTYSNTKYLTSEMKKNNIEMVVGITKASTTQSFVVISLKPDYTFSYDGLDKVTPILTGSKYTGVNEVTNIKSDIFDFSAIKA